MSTTRIASWNIRKAVGLDRRRDPLRVLGVIADLGAGIVALQEADKRLGERPSALPRERITEETGLVPIDTDNGPSLGWHGNAILVAPDFKIGRVLRLDLPGLEPRGALVADLSREGEKLRVAAVHLGLTRRHRRRQLATLLEALSARPPRPTLILGDFNEWSAEKGLEPLSETFTVHSPGMSFHAARPVAALDRVATCPALEVRDAGVLETLATRVASDHLPVWTAISPARNG
jgi:endonuclease/exonuclease/phosphatase family metal-dependent hydrolase